MPTGTSLSLTPRLKPPAKGDAIRLLQAYYAGVLGSGTGYEGGWWDGFDPSGTRRASQYVFTADDLLSASLLSAPIHPTSLLKILGPSASTLTTALEALGEDRDLVELTADEVTTLEASSTIWSALRAIPHVGPTRASKLIARKRPQLIPIYDNVVGAAVYAGTSSGQWRRLHRALTSDNNALHTHLVTLREDAGLPRSISPLRVFDVIAWLDASDDATRILA